MNCALNKKFIAQKHTCITKGGMCGNVGVLAMLAMRAGCRNVEVLAMLADCGNVGVLAMLTMLEDVRGVQKTTRLSRRKTGCKNLNMYRNNTA